MAPNTSEDRRLTSSAENYLEAVLMVQDRKGVARSVDLALQLGVSKPSVSVAVHTLEEAGYLTMDADKHLHLTDAGLAIARKVYERHRFFTKALILLGVDPAVAEADACRIEHDISDATFEIVKSRCCGSGQPAEC